MENDRLLVGCTGCMDAAGIHPYPDALANPGHNVTLRLSVQVHFGGVSRLGVPRGHGELSDRIAATATYHDAHPGLGPDPTWNRLTSNP